MKYLFSLVLVLGLVSCESTPADRMAFRALDDAWRCVAPEYMGYVSADPTLTDAQKHQRVMLVADVTTLLTEKVEKAVK